MCKSSSSSIPFFTIFCKGRNHSQWRPHWSPRNDGLRPKPVLRRCALARTIMAIVHYMWFLQFWSHFCGTIHWNSVTTRVTRFVHFPSKNWRFWHFLKKIRQISTKHLVTHQIVTFWPFGKNMSCSNWDLIIKSKASWYSNRVRLIIRLVFPGHQFYLVHKTCFGFALATSDTSKIPSKIS